MENYKSKWTGTQIDEGIELARNAAPGGYGLGSTAMLLTDADDLNTIGRAGWYYWLANMPQNTEGLTYCTMRVDCGLDAVNYATQTLYNIGGKTGELRRRNCIDGVWYPWEYVNPPMIVGVEYRTTERYQGKAVYKKLDTDGVIKWRIDGETEWKPEVQYTGAAAVLATTVPSRTVTVAASELAAYVAALPRMVNEALTISVTSGTVSETLMLDGFYGSGRLTIAQASGASVQYTKGIRIQYCTMRIRLYNLTVSGEGAAVGDFQELISIGPASCVYVDSCTLTGNGSARGISAGQCCIVEVASCTITHTNIALLMSKASVCAAYDCSGSSNTTGAYVYYGGCIMLAGSTPDTLGGSANVKSGGIIVKANGTLL